MEERIRQRIDALKAERDLMIDAANKQIAAYKNSFKLVAVYI